MYNPNVVIFNTFKHSHYYVVQRLEDKKLQTTTSTISSIESTDRGEESQPEEESPDVGTSGCTCSCAIHQSPPKHTMPRAVQTRQSMRSKGDYKTPKSF